MRSSGETISMHRKGGDVKICSCGSTPTVTQISDQQRLQPAMVLFAHIPIHYFAIHVVHIRTVVGREIFLNGNGCERFHIAARPFQSAVYISSLALESAERMACEVEASLKWPEKGR